MISEPTRIFLKFYFIFISCARRKISERRPLVEWRRVPRRAQHLFNLYMLKNENEKKNEKRKSEKKGMKKKKTEEKYCAAEDRAARSRIWNL